MTPPVELHAIRIPSSGWAFGVRFVPSRQSILNATGFTNQAIIAELLLEMAWHVGLNDEGRFVGQVIHSEGIAPENWIMFTEPPLDTALSEPGFHLSLTATTYYPVDKADLRRLFYPPFDLPRIEVAGPANLHAIVPVQSRHGWLTTWDAAKIGVAADRACGQLGVPFVNDSQLISEMLGRNADLSQFDF